MWPLLLPVLLLSYRSVVSLRADGLTCECFGLPAFAVLEMAICAPAHPGQPAQRFELGAKCVSPDSFKPEPRAQRLWLFCCACQERPHELQTTLSITVAPALRRSPLRSLQSQRAAQSPPDKQRASQWRPAELRPWPISGNRTERRSAVPHRRVTRLLRRRPRRVGRSSP